MQRNKVYFLKFILFIFSSLYKLKGQIQALILSTHYLFVPLQQRHYFRPYMNNKLLSYTNKVKKAAFYIPFTAYFFVFIVLIFFANSLIHPNEINKDSSFAEILFLLIKVATFFIITLISISFVLVLISWLHFMYWKKKKGIYFNIEIKANNESNQEKQTVLIQLNPIFKPIMGFLKMRLLYDKKYFSHKFSMLEKSNNKIFDQKIEGTYHWALPEIKEYKLEKAIIYFEDVFQFFSLAASLPANNNFYAHPVSSEISNLQVSPRKTEETNTRIDQMRKVEGEFLNYKNFENNDDVRRIVWKIYAKNKELVVRIPEIMDPYASHVYLYASFFTSFNIEGNEPIEIPFLNFYKTITWSIYQSLAKQGFEVKYIPDHEVSTNNIADEQQWVKYAISSSYWHSEKVLNDFVQTNNASVVIISSLSDVAQVRALSERYGNEIRFIFIKLTDSFKHQNIGDWLQWIFIKNEQQDIDVYKRKWAVSLLREKIKENERKLEESISALQSN